MLQAFKQWVKRRLPRAYDLLRSTILVLKTLLPRPFSFILYRAVTLPAPDMHDLTVEVVEYGRSLSPEHRDFILRDLSKPSLAHLRRHIRRDWGAIFLTRTEGEYCDYMFCTSVKRQLPLFPVMREPKARIIGPGYTDPRFRGRAIHTRVMQYIANYAAARGYGPFYGVVLPDNAAANRTMEKAGWTRVGVWAGVRALRDHWVRTERVSD